MVELTFLGSGGGRFMTITQKRGTGGFILKDDVKMHVDPGPGALLKSWEQDEDPRELDAILLSHCHIDHTNDSSILIEAMTNGATQRRGVLIGSESAISGIDGGSTPFNFNERFVERVETLSAGDETTVGNVSIRATPTIHSDPTTIGFKFTTSQGIVSYSSDTQFFPDLVKWHSDARVLIMCVTRPAKHRIPYHLTTTDAVKVAHEVKPEVLVLTHIGMKFHLQGVEEERDAIEERTGIRTIVADEGKKLIIEGDAITTSL